jgi:sugar/nucleoside kinase (ribokinase family)
MSAVAPGRDVVIELAQQGGPGRAVIATDGERGAWGIGAGDERDMPIHAAALPVAVCDSTGAGDAFHAGFVKALLDGREWREAMDFATRLGACACATPGPAVTRESLQRCGLLLGQRESVTSPF